MLKIAAIQETKLLHKFSVTGKIMVFGNFRGGTSVTLRS